MRVATSYMYIIYKCMYMYMFACILKARGMLTLIILHRINILLAPNRQNVLSLHLALNSTSLFMHSMYTENNCMCCTCICSSALYAAKHWIIFCCWLNAHGSYKMWPCTTKPTKCHTFLFLVFRELEVIKDVHVHLYLVIIGKFAIF